MMETLDRRLVRAPLAAVFAAARDVERWPAILPHYRWVRRHPPRPDRGAELVEMAAWRPFGPLRWPTWWMSEMWVDEARAAVRYRHIAGITRGMDVEWSLTPRDGGTEVVILHRWDGPAWPLIRRPAAEWIIGPVFVHGIASRTLAGIARHVEGGTAGGRDGGPAGRRNDGPNGGTAEPDSARLAAPSPHAGHGANLPPSRRPAVPPDLPPSRRPAVPPDLPPWLPHPPAGSATPMVQSLHALVPEAEPYLPGAGVDRSTLPLARPREVVALADGDTLELTAGLVRRRIGGRELTMYGFNGQYPGPLLRVAERGTVVVRFRNRTDWPTTIHWHGIRLDNRFDGVPGVTQGPVPPGGEFTYRIRFPDAGIYWYHPHHREDVLQDLGLYGNILVDPARAGLWNRVHAEEALILDDLLVGDGGLVPWGADTPTHALMGRFGNVLLVNGEPGWRYRARRGAVVRFHLTNVSNTRTWNLSFGDAPMKLVGSDVGRFEREQWVESVVLAPAERYTVEVRFDRPGRVPLVNRVQAIDHVAGVFFPETDTLGVVEVARGRAEPDLGAGFGRLRTHEDVVADVDRYRPHFDRAPDRRLVLTLETDGLPFALEQLLRLDTTYVNPVEWSGTMPMMDWLSTGRQARWILRDPATGRTNMAIDWRFRRGDVVKLRLINDRHTLHPMPHPIHLHGQRFLVLAVNGEPTGNLVWKDTALVPVGSTVDVLVDMTNPGLWMLHCHVAEHLSTGMQAVFEVE